MMSRKHYQAIAGALREARDNIRTKEPERAHADLQDGVSYAADYIADALAQDNPRFDRARFLKACGLDQ